MIPNCNRGIRLMSTPLPLRFGYIGKERDPPVPLCPLPLWSNIRDLDREDLVRCLVLPP